MFAFLFWCCIAFVVILIGGYLVAIAAAVAIFVVVGIPSATYYSFLAACQFIYRISIASFYKSLSFQQYFKTLYQKQKELS